MLSADVFRDIPSLTVYPTHLAEARRQLPAYHPLPTQAVQSLYRQAEPLPPRNNSIAIQDDLRLTCVLALYSSMSMPNDQQMPTLQGHSWCHLKKDGRLRILYHHTTTLNKDHNELKTSLALISDPSEKPDDLPPLVSTIIYNATNSSSKAMYRIGSYP
jgi:hypothetical protein